MSQTEKEQLGGGAGLAGAVAVESGVELGEIEVKARGYWEQVWRRFKRDKVAIAGGITIIFILLVGFVGAPIAKALLGHGPDTIFPVGGLTPFGLPVGPFSRIPDDYHPGQTTLFLLGS